jgi:hypothetical protein
MALVGVGGKFEPSLAWLSSKQTTVFTAYKKANSQTTGKSCIVEF